MFASNWSIHVVCAAGVERAAGPVKDSAQKVQDQARDARKQ